MDKTERFKGLEWFDSSLSPTGIIIGGQGGIGSWLSLLLSRITKGHVTNIHCYDHDRVEEQNIGGQLFSSRDIGSRKAIAISSFVNTYGVNRIFPICAKYDENSDGASVMFSCFDNMEARKIMFNKWKENGYENKLFVDGRLLAEDYEIYFVTPDNAARYEETLFDDADIPEAPCSAKQTSHYAASIAADMIKGYTNWLSNLAEKDVRELPFKVREIGALFHKTIEL